MCNEPAPEGVPSYSLSPDVRPVGSTRKNFQPDESFLGKPESWCGSSCLEARGLKTQAPFPKSRRARRRYHRRLRIAATQIGNLPLQASGSPSTAALCTDLQAELGPLVQGPGGKNFDTERVFQVQSPSRVKQGRV